jgi:hypothetical protein
MATRTNAIFVPDGENAIHDGIEHESGGGKALLDPTEGGSKPMRARLPTSQAQTRVHGPTSVFRTRAPERKSAALPTVIGSA